MEGGGEGVGSGPETVLFNDLNAPNIRIGDDQIQLSNKEKLLGVIDDTSLNWSAQVEAPLIKSNSLLYLL